MNPLVEEWIKKAEGDWNTANRELRARKNPNYDSACFHCQQCAEKYLKAYLQYKDQEFTKIHNLLKLLELCLEYDSSFEFQRDILDDLNHYAILFRYPGEEANRFEAKSALKGLKIFRNFIQQLLKIKISN